MANIFEQLMGQNRQLTESVAPRKSSKKVTESTKKIRCSKIKLESLKFLENADIDELDAQFAVDPEESGEDEVVLVIDPEIPSDEEVPEDAAEQMVGDEIYKCSVCGSNYVCDCDAEMHEGIEVDEEGHPIECPICGDDADQILIGEIAPAEDAGDPDDLDPVDKDDSLDKDPEDDEEGLEEGLFNKDPEDNLDKEEEDLDPVEGGLELEVPTEDPEDEDAPAVEIDANVVNLTLDDGRFESLMTRMIRENYKFNPTFKITKVSAQGSKLKVEYLVRENTKKVTRGIMVAEGFDRKSRTMTLKFKDKGAFTESFTRTPSFVIECVRIRNKVIPTEVKYNFVKKVNESLYRVSGRVDSKKNDK